MKTLLEKYGMRENNNNKRERNVFYQQLDGQLTIHMLVKAIQNLQNGIPDDLLLIFFPPFSSGSFFFFVLV